MAKPHNGCGLGLLVLSMVVYAISCSAYIGSINDTTLMEVELGDWDQFVLSLQWPITACKKMGCTTSTKYWTIHGLWPGYSNKATCPICPKSPYDKSIESIPEVRNYWPDLKRGGGKMNFWQYEWYKHGICAVDLIQTKNCRKYFEKTCDLYTDYNPKRALEKGGIKPSTKGYLAKDIQRALEKYFSPPLLRCYFKDSKYYLGEIHFCINKSFRPKSCYKGDKCGDKDDQADVMDDYDVEDDVMDVGYGNYYRPCPDNDKVYFPDK